MERVEHLVLVFGAGVAAVDVQREGASRGRDEGRREGGVVRDGGVGVALAGDRLGLDLGRPVRGVAARPGQRERHDLDEARREARWPGTKTTEPGVVGVGCVTVAV